MIDNLFFNSTLQWYCWFLGFILENLSTLDLALSGVKRVKGNASPHGLSWRLIHSDEGLTLERQSSNLLRWLIYLIDPVVDNLF